MVDTVIATQTVVIDNGSGMIKAGLAGDETPKCLFPSFIGKIKNRKVMAGGLDGELFVGSKAEELRGLLKLKYPIEHGIVQDWSEMERIWNFIYSELRVQSEEHPILLTEAPLNPRKNREKAVEIFFETFGVPAFYVAQQAVLSLYASGRTTGVVLDSGDGVTQTVPIYEGFAIPHAISRIDIAGRDVTKYLQLLLRKSGNIFTTTAEFEIVKNIKEQTCQVMETIPTGEFDTIVKSSQILYRLPDGNDIQIGNERIQAPEILFNPEIIGSEFDSLPQILFNSIHQVDIDLRSRLYENIVLSGGSTLFPGFGNRLLNEIKTKAPKDIKIRISAPPERKFSTWIGGSILASLATFKKMWISMHEYDDGGAAIVHKKCF